MTKMEQLAKKLKEGKKPALDVLKDNVIESELLDYDDFVRHSWFYDEEVSGCPELAYATIKLAGEAGEVAEKVGKSYRDDAGVVKKNDVILELGDVLFYLTHIADLLGVDLETVARSNMDKIIDRRKRGTLAGSGDHR